MASFAIVPLVLATCYEVLARYLFGAPTIWAYEIGYTLTGSHFLLGMAYTLRWARTSASTSSAASSRRVPAR